MAPKIKEISAPVTRIGEAIVIPEKIRLRDAANYIGKLADQEEQDVRIDEIIDGYLFGDVAACFKGAMEDIFGYSLQNTKVVEFFGMEFKDPPKLLTLQTSLNTSTQVPYGEFSIPGIDGTVNLMPMRRSGAMVSSRIVAEIKRKDQAVVQRLVNKTRELLRTQSIYRGQAFGLALTNADGEAEDMPMPVFMDIANTVEPIFNRDVEVQIGASIYAPITRTAEMRAMGIPLKRGVCLYGPFGTGKSLTSRRVAQLAVDNHWTFIKVEKPNEFAEILKLARNFGQCVVFCEDIDRVAAGRRTIELDQILNNLDGIESKDAEIIVVVTTNEFDDINRAMLRAGRLDASIPVPFPDEDASERLLRFYAGDLLPATEDITVAAKEMAGKIPASAVEEVIKRSKLYILNQRRMNNDPVDYNYKASLNAAALRDATMSVVEEHISTNNKAPKRDLTSATPQEKAAYIVADAQVEAARLAAEAQKIAAQLVQNEAATAVGNTVN
jgi:transitional endoplasmic reticulum ATPase